MNGLDLFTGIGGFSLALKFYFGRRYRTVCYVENNRYCQRIIQARVGDGFLDDAPIWDDIKTFDGQPWAGCVDIITAGFPCQPWSVAGKRKGESDERNLWPALMRVIGEVRPLYVLLENVPNLLAQSYFGTILGDLASCGYDCRWDCIPASIIGANHQRDRLWILAYPTEQRSRCQQIELRNKGLQQDCTRWAGMGHELGDGSQDVANAPPWKDDERETRNMVEETGRGQSINTAFSTCDTDVADTESPGLMRGNRPQKYANTESRAEGWDGTFQWWETEPAVGRVVDGLPYRLDRLRSLGNAIVPAVAAEFLRRFFEAEVVHGM